MSNFIVTQRRCLSLRSWPSIAVCLSMGGLSMCGCQFASSAMNADGVRLHQSGNYPAAASRFTEAIANDPAGANAYYNLAATYHQMGKTYGRDEELKQAENLYNQCLDRDTNHTDCYRALSVLLVDMDRTSEALRLLDGWAMRDPRSPDPKIEMARLLEEFGERDKAKQRLEEALVLDPTNARALAALGKLHERLGDPQQALVDYQRSLDVNRQQPHVASRVAAIQASLGGPMMAHSPGETRMVGNPRQTRWY